MDYIKARLAEPSTHAGIAALISIAGAMFPQYSMLIYGIAGLFGVSAVVKADK